MYIFLLTIFYNKGNKNKIFAKLAVIIVIYTFIYIYIFILIFQKQLNSAIEMNEFHYLF